MISVCPLVAAPIVLPLSYPLRWHPSLSHYRTGGLPGRMVVLPLALGQVSPPLMYPSGGAKGFAPVATTLSKHFRPWATLA